ncbi:MAG TPA: winged helix DNA-binding domain-containing protein [Thermomicrobiales bacterium]|nr:winged helix DNA-binding domain-containing protein [Thermomicrobiales bacterium]
MESGIMNFQDIARLRAANQTIENPRFNNILDVVTWMGAIQGQDYTSSLLAIALRTPSLTTADVTMAFAEREIVRTWPMRGTLHIVPTRDASWMVRLLGNRGIVAARKRRDDLGLDAATTLRALNLFTEVLSAGPQTRPELYEALRLSGIDPDGQRGIHLIGYAAQSGVICGIGKSGNQPAFALLEQWCPNPVHLEGDEAWATLAGRYIQSHGPVTERDFAWWAGITLSQAKQAFSIDASKYERIGVDKDTFVISGCDMLGLDDQPGTVLVPAFDESYLGYGDRSAMLARELQPLVVPGGNGVFRPVVLTAGKVVGTWSWPSRIPTDPEIGWFWESGRPPPRQLDAAFGRLRAARG